MISWIFVTNECFYCSVWLKTVLKIGFFFYFSNIYQICFYYLYILGGIWIHWKIYTDWLIIEVRVDSICFYLLGAFHCRLFFLFYSISAISVTLLLYNNGQDFPGSNNRTLFSLLAWHWLTIRRDFPIDIRDKHRGFPQRDITLHETNQAKVNLSNHFSVLI